MADPKPLVQFIREAIDEVAPGRGAEIYWLAFRRWETYSAARLRKAQERELSKEIAEPELALEDIRR